MNMLIIFAAKYLFIVVCLMALGIFVLSDRLIESKIIRLSFFTLPLSYLISLVLNQLIISPRPFVVEHIQPLIQASIDNGFPSDHTLLTMTVAFIIFAYNKKWGSLLVLLSLVVGIARVMAHVHHRIDVAGSIGIAGVATYISYRYLIGIPYQHIFR